MNACLIWSFVCLAALTVQSSVSVSHAFGQFTASHARSKSSVEHLQPSTNLKFLIDHFSKIESLLAKDEKGELFQPIEIDNAFTPPSGKVDELRRRIDNLNAVWIKDTVPPALENLQENGRLDYYPFDPKQRQKSIQSAIKANEERIQLLDLWLKALDQFEQRRAKIEPSSTFKPNSPTTLHNKKLLEKLDSNTMSFKGQGL